MCQGLQFLMHLHLKNVCAQEISVKAAQSADLDKSRFLCTWFELMVHLRCILVVFVHLHLKNVGLCTGDLHCHDLQTGPSNGLQSMASAHRRCRSKKKNGVLIIFLPCWFAHLQSWYILNIIYSDLAKITTNYTENQDFWHFGPDEKCWFVHQRSPWCESCHHLQDWTKTTKMHLRRTINLNQL